MDERRPDDPAKTYVAILRGFGLGDGSIVDLHGGPDGVAVDEGSGQPRSGHVGGEAPTPFARLRDALVQSPRGFSAPVGAVDPPPVDRIANPLEAVGYDLAVDREGGSYRLTVAGTGGGSGDDATFSFPDGPLGTGNLPAFVHAVDRLLDDRDLSFVLLSPGEDRWRFVLADADGLDALRGEFGERIVAFGRPLLAPHQPPAYAGGAPPASEYVPGGTDGPESGDPTEPRTAGQGGESVADTPEWIRSAAAREGGIEAILEALEESGPRTYVSGRSADDVLSEIPDSIGDGATETRTAGTDDVLERLRDHHVPGEGPSTAVSDRPLDVFKGEPDAGGDPGSVTKSEPGSEHDARVTGDPDRDASSPDVDGPTTDAGTGTDGTTETEPAGATTETGPEGPPDRGSEGPTAGSDRDEAVPETGEADGGPATDRTGSGEEAAGKQETDKRAPRDSLVGGGPDEVVVEGSVDDILADPDPADEGARAGRRETDPKADPSADPAASRSGTDPTEWEPVPEAPPEDEAGAETAEEGADAGVADLIEDAEGGGPPDSWEPVGSGSPIRDAEADASEGADGASGGSPPESRFDGAMNPSDIDTDGDEDDEDTDGVVDRIRAAFDRFRS